MGAASKAIDIFLQPGEYFVGDADFRIRTLLGSCVSVTLWYPARRVGAMSHYLLPARTEMQREATPDSRYGEDALALMLDELKAKGVRASQCKAKIFGGGDMFPGQRKNSFNIGRRNGEAARALLARHDIEVISESLYGVGHRQIIFDLSTGHVWARQIKLINNPLNNPLQELPD